MSCKHVESRTCSTNPRRLSLDGASSASACQLEFAWALEPQCQIAWNREKTQWVVISFTAWRYTRLISQSECPKDKPFLLTHSRHARNSYDPKLKRIFQIPWSFFEIFPFIRFGIAWTGRINLKIVLGYDIKYLSIWAFMSYPCFPTEKVSKVTFILFCQKNSHEINRGYFSGKRG